MKGKWAKEKRRKGPVVMLENYKRKIEGGILS